MPGAKRNRTRMSSMNQSHSKNIGYLAPWVRYGLHPVRIGLVVRTPTSGSLEGGAL